MNNALAQHPEIDFLVSPGDQINEPAGDGNAEKFSLRNMNTLDIFLQQHSATYHKL